MQPSFWHERWASGQIGFHEPAPNPLLTGHFDALDPAPGARLFLPLCGKTLDIDCILSRGFEVTASELSAIAVTALFERLQMTPVVEQHGDLQRWRTPRLAVWVGDHFSLEPDSFGRVDAVYDRAALIAMPPDMRAAYATQMTRLAGDAPQLLVTLEYEQSRLDGPPFSVGEDDLRQLYPAHARRRLATAAIDGGLKGKVPATETVWMLTRG